MPADLMIGKVALLSGMPARGPYLSGLGFVSLSYRPPAPTGPTPLEVREVAMPAPLKGIAGRVVLTAAIVGGVWLAYRALRR